MDPISEQKLVNIAPLPETKDGEDLVSKAMRMKPGRKFDPDAKSRKKTDDNYTVTEKRKQALLKARMAKADKRKKIQDEIHRLLEDAQNQVSENLISKSTEDIKDKPVVEVVADKPDAAAHPHLHERMGTLENQLKTITEQLSSLMSVGAFNGHNGNRRTSQTFQTIPAEPTEYRRPDMYEPTYSYMRMANGGASKMEVMPNQENREPLPPHPQHRIPTPFFF